ncbi:MAG TPA: competence/damage-inducible protein A, partial [Anaerohalosphaeraceae bacterium]|nr:competence/damage-inducible protein A [Phycisphaerae bacterium]HOK96331.1 competence/damage-inducible protein A [Anaerohalosphaeraceae bacterium]HOL31597.1 competence/damage-inducible protein A [Anaerohalosphaeraceae bacterium]HOM75863.1 competence/damage-inducible protein A [Anaerohalosphaeraceae bacterium]HPC63477.1 competence/damage-inducible protein A [Anaerohalosphaeraceae bacterium]
MKKVGIISIGNELLNGHTTDTNASWLAGELLAMGLPTAGVWTVPDEISRIIHAFDEASREAEILLITGGLGPTDDDLTRQAAASWLGTDLVFQPEWLDKIADFFKKRGRTMPARNQSQAYIPAGCRRLDNPAGTACGFWGLRNGVFFAAMPGVPEEMKRMFNEQVKDQIDTAAQGAFTAAGKLHCFGAGESDIAQRLGDLMNRRRNPLINCTCGAGEVVLHIIASADSKMQAMKMVQDDKQRLKALLGNIVFGEDDSSLPAAVGQLLREKHKTIAAAESCTGGLLSKMLTDIPGSSAYMLAGWVTYSNEAKVRQLGVPEQFIRDFGAVSRQVASAMAEGAAKRSGADIAVSITGIAGPDGGSEEKPVGLVFIGVWTDGICDVQRCRFGDADRQSIRQRAAMTALNLVRLRLQV